MELIDLIYPFMENVKENSLTVVFHWFSVRENLDSNKHIIQAVLKYLETSRDERK